MSARESGRSQGHPIAATIITGFLGSGKTTLLNHLLSQPPEYKFAVLVNEFGEIGIDDELIEKRDEELVLLRNGCICCSIRKDLVVGIERLLARGGFDYLLIETTGLADPGPIAKTFFNVPSLSPYVRLDSVVTVVDAEQIDRNAAEAQVCLNQIALADFVLLNKTDLVADSDLLRIERNIRRLNNHAEIVRTQRSVVEASRLLDKHAFDADVNFHPNPEVPKERGRGEEARISSVSFRHDGLFDAFRFQSFLEALSAKQRVFRSKGILAFAGSKRRAVFHGVNNRFTIYWDRAWRTDEARESKLVFIGIDLARESIERELDRCVRYELSPELTAR